VFKEKFFPTFFFSSSQNFDWLAVKMPKMVANAIKCEASSD
jgi:hypothetical protein